MDRTLTRENLRLSVEQRFEQLMRLQEFAQQLGRARVGSRSLRDDRLPRVDFAVG